MLEGQVAPLGRSPMNVSTLFEGTINQQQKQCLALFPAKYLDKWVDEVLMKIEITILITLFRITQIEY